MKIKVDIKNVQITARNKNGEIVALYEANGVSYEANVHELIDAISNTMSSLPTNGTDAFNDFMKSMQ